MCIWSPKSNNRKSVRNIWANSLSNCVFPANVNTNWCTVWLDIDRAQTQPCTHAATDALTQACTDARTHAHTHWWNERNHDIFFYRLNLVANCFKLHKCSVCYASAHWCKLAPETLEWREPFCLTYFCSWKQNVLMSTCAVLGGDERDK